MVSTSPTSESLESFGPAVYRDVYAIISAEKAAVDGIRRLLERGESDENIVAWFGDERVQAHVSRLLDQIPQKFRKTSQG